MPLIRLEKFLSMGDNHLTELFTCNFLQHCNKYMTCVMPYFVVYETIKLWEVQANRICQSVIA